VQQQQQQHPSKRQCLDSYTPSRVVTVEKRGKRGGKKARERAEKKRAFIIGGTWSEEYARERHTNAKLSVERREQQENEERKASRAKKFTQSEAISAIQTLIESETRDVSPEPIIVSVKQKAPDQRAVDDYDDLYDLNELDDHEEVEVHEVHGNGTVYDDDDY
jgi:hypothetical protein